MISRRDLITPLGSVVAFWPLVRAAEQPDRMRPVGMLMVLAEPYPFTIGYVRALRGELLLDLADEVIE
jgi:hypothetical protein